MNGNDVVDALRRKLKASSDKELADRLGRSLTSVHHWRSLEQLTPLQIANMVADGKQVAKQEAAHEAIRTIVEFFPVTPLAASGGQKVELFPTADDPYRKGLRAELERVSGIYLFYDSRGRALYVGKTERQSLWAEMKQAFNRGRNQIHQNIYRVDHADAAFDPDIEGRRQIAQRAVPLSELARYFTAYEVRPAMIPQLEALLVRGFANDVLNHRMEKFSHQKGGG